MLSMDAPPNPRNSRIQQVFERPNISGVHDRRAKLPKEAPYSDVAPDVISISLL
jgi:hypothetical protein